MATQLLSNTGNALRLFYAPMMTRSLNNKVPLYQRLKDAKVEDIKLEGQDLVCYIPVHTKRNQGIGWYSEGGTFPTARARSYSQMKAGLGYIGGSFNISGQLMAAAESNQHAFVKAVTEDMKDLQDGLTTEVGRAFWGDGSGALCTISEASGSVVAGSYITVDNAAQLEPGMRIDSYDYKTGGTQGLNSVVIDQVDYNNNKFTLTATATVKQNDLVFREDSRGNYCMGLLGIVDGADSSGNYILSTFQNTARSSNLWAGANVLDNAGSNRSISVSLIQQAFERSEIISGDSPTVILSSYGVRRAYFDLCQADKRYINMKTIDGGFTALEYSGGSAPIPWIADRMCWKNRVFFLHEPELKKYNATNGIKFADADGAVLARASDDSYDARAVCYITLGCHKPQSNTVLRDITE